MRCPPDPAVPAHPRPAGRATGHRHGGRPGTGGTVHDPAPIDRHEPGPTRPRENPHPHPRGDRHRRPRIAASSDHDPPSSTARPRAYHRRSPGVAVRVKLTPPGEGPPHPRPVCGTGAERLDRGVNLPDKSDHGTHWSDGATNHSPGGPSPPERETGAVHPAAPLRLLSPVASGNAHRSAASHSFPIDTHRIALLVDCGHSAGPSTLAAMPLGLDRFRHDRLADADRPARLPAAMTTPALSDDSLTTGTDPVTGPESVLPLRSDLTQSGQHDAEQGDVSDANAPATTTTESRNPANPPASATPGRPPSCCTASTPAQHDQLTLRGIGPRPTLRGRSRG